MDVSEKVRMEVQASGVVFRRKERSYDPSSDSLVQVNAETPKYLKSVERQQSSNIRLKLS